jgi:hypothetical protein
MWSDAGEYECNAGNERGNDAASEVLKVTGKILIQCWSVCMQCNECMNVDIIWLLIF